MRHRILLFIYLFFAVAMFTTGCSKQQETETSTEELAIRGLKQLFTNAAPIEISESGESSFLVSEREISISTTVEQELKRDGKWFCGLRFDVAINGVDYPEFTYGSVGVGDSKEEARQIAIEEWLAAFGIPFVSAMLESDTGIEFNTFTAYAGPMGIRGEHPGGWLDATDEMHTRLLLPLIPILESDPTWNQATLDLKLVVGDAGELDGECRLNAQLSSNILSVLNEMSWPLSESPYMFKQYYVIIRK